MESSSSLWSRLLAVRLSSSPSSSPPVCPAHNEHIFKFRLWLSYYWLHRHNVGPEDGELRLPLVPAAGRQTLLLSLLLASCLSFLE